MLCFMKKEIKMKDTLDFIKSFDLHTIIIVAVAFWWLNSGMNAKFEKLGDQVNDIDKRLSRIEGAFSVRTVCTLNEIKVKDEKE